jgi:hypothetical protein
MIAGCLLMAGPTATGGMNHAAIGWADLVAWSGNSGYGLDAWALEAIREASAAYAVQLSTSHGKNTPAPWGAVKADPADVSKRLQAGLRGIIQGRRK